MKAALIALGLLVIGGVAAAQDVEGYRSAREALVTLHRDEREGPWRSGRGVDALCGCDIDPGTMKAADPLKCPPLRESKDDSDADLVALQIVDSRSAAERLTCGRVGNRFCVDEKTGLKMRGPSCCQHDPEYVPILRDPHLSLLAPRIVARRLAGLRPALFMRPEVKADICGVRIDPENGTFALPPYMAGFGARAWLHGAMSYRIEPPSTLGELARIALSQPPIDYEIALSRAARRNGVPNHRGVAAQLENLAPLNMTRR